MIILGIDPGPTLSAAVLWNTKSEEVKASWTEKNDEFRKKLIAVRDTDPPGICIIEGIIFYGRVINVSAFHTLMLIGRLQEIFYGYYKIVYFPDIAYYFCGSSRGLFTGLRDMKCPPWLPLYIGGKALRYRAAKKNVL